MNVDENLEATGWSGWYVPNTDCPFIEARRQSNVTAMMNWVQFRSRRATPVTFTWQPVGSNVGHERQESLAGQATGAVTRCDEVVPVQGEIEINVLRWA